MPRNEVKAPQFLTMQTKVSKSGQGVLPAVLRRRENILPGDPLDVNVEVGRIILAPKKKPHRVKFVTDPVTGLPALGAGTNAPSLSSREVAEILAHFP